MSMAFLVYNHQKEVLMIVNIIRDFLKSKNLCLDYTIQPYVWEELQNPVFDKYLVIQPDGTGSQNKEEVTDNVRMIFLGDRTTNKLALNREVMQVEDAFLNTAGMIDNVYAFDLIGRSAFFKTEEGRPAFEINVRCNGVKYAC